LTKARPTYGPDSSGNSGFAVGNGGSLYAIGAGTDLSSWGTTGGTTPGTLTLTFRFYVSAAMLAGNDWTVRATATDDAGLEGTATTETNAVTVQYFGAVTTARTSIDYGTIAPGASAPVIDQPLGLFVANDGSETDLVGEDFTYVSGPFTSTLDLVDEATPGSGEVSLRCWRGDAELGDSASIRVVPVTPRDLPSSVFGGAGAARGTGETPIELKHGCELFYGGGALVSSQQYQADITVGIRQVSTDRSVLPGFGPASRECVGSPVRLTLDRGPGMGMDMTDGSTNEDRRRRGARWVLVGRGHGRRRPHLASSFLALALAVVLLVATVPALVTTRSALAATGEQAEVEATESGATSPPGEADVGAEGSDAEGPEGDEEGTVREAEGEAVKLDVSLVAVPALLEPGHPTGTTVHEFDARIRPAGGATPVPITRVTLCLRAPVSDDAVACEVAADDPRSAVLMTWDAEEGSVVVAGDDGHRDAGSEVLDDDGAWLVRFRLTIAAVTAAGPGWTATVSVEDGAGATATARAEGLEVAWFGVRLAPREEADHGTVDAGAKPSPVTTGAGLFLANGAARIVMRATPFVQGDDVLALAGGAADDPAPWRTVGLDCALDAGPATETDQGSLTRVGEDWTPVGAVLAIGSSREPLLVTTGCRLRYGGGAAYSGAQYSNDVHVDIVPHLP
jgi:hypothetical protein